MGHLHRTSTRTELINLCGAVAKSFNFAALSPNDPNYICTTSYADFGKALVAETFIKALLDEYDVQDLKNEGEQDKLFLESRPGEGIHKILWIDGHHNKRPLRFIFYRPLLTRDQPPGLNEEALLKCQNITPPPKGARTIYFCDRALRGDVQKPPVAPIDCALHVSMLFLPKEERENLPSGYDNRKWHKRVSFDTSNDLGVFDLQRLNSNELH